MNKLFERIFQFPQFILPLMAAITVDAAFVVAITEGELKFLDEDTKALDEQLEQIFKDK